MNRYSFCPGGIHTLTQGTTHAVELRPIIMRLIFVCGDLDIIDKLFETFFTKDVI